MKQRGSRLSSSDSMFFFFFLFQISLLKWGVGWDLVGEIGEDSKLDEGESFGEAGLIRFSGVDV